MLVVDQLFVVDGLLRFIYRVDADEVDYDDHLYNNNDTNNDTPDCMSGVENNCSSTERYGNNNISSIDIYGVTLVYLLYNSTALVATLDTITSSGGRSFVLLSIELAPIPSLSSNIFSLSSDCCIVCLKHVPVALVASVGTISSLSSPYLSPVPKFLFSSNSGLYSCSSSSYTKSPSRAYYWT